jgi:hypothetical protein
VLHCFERFDCNVYCTLELQNVQIMTNFYSQLNNFLIRGTLIFICLFITSFSFPYSLLPDIGLLTHRFYESIARFIGLHILHLSPASHFELISDSTGYYMNAAFLFVFSYTISLASIKIRKINILCDIRSTKQFLTAIIKYFLICHLFIYGFDKVFKTQFFLPEPNTLFTNIGNASKALLYWSTMGVSRPYTIFCGITELMCATLLIPRRSQWIGAFMASLVMANVFAINCCYNISVKLFSLFLLLLSLLLVLSDWETIKIILGKEFIGQVKQKKWQYGIVSNRWRLILKSFIVCVIIAEGLTPYINANNFNDDKEPRPQFHGTYHIQKQQSSNLNNITSQNEIKRIHIHRRGFLILEYEDNSMDDFELQFNMKENELILFNSYEGEKDVLHFETKSGQLNRIFGNLGIDSISWELRMVNLDSLIVFKNDFQWTIDD